MSISFIQRLMEPVLIGSNPMASYTRDNLDIRYGLVFQLAMAALALMLLMLLTGCERSFWDPTVKVNATGSDILTPVLGREAREDAGNG